jgi:asparagine synthase (glutamine-hydrolysing)
MWAAPVDYWLARNLKEMVDDLRSESQIQKRGLFRHEAVRAFVDVHRSGAQDWSMQIWQLSTVELWMQIFLDGGGKHAAADLIHRQQAATA